MAKTFRYDGDSFGHVAASFYECDECSIPITANGSYAEDTDGFKLFVCTFCARQFSQSVAIRPIAVEMYA